ncbi:MAG: lipooligosaccharide sialyltransferase [Lachnospiraceae bacterium]|nr:lipooligosaccharide sialyltransferase [Lachnospiraceae bacterium]
MDKKGRVYVCHTYYHVYVALLKEFNLDKEERFKADLVLSLMSNDFENLSDRILENKVFENVYHFDEKRETFFPEVMKYKENKGNIVANMISRIKFTKEFAKAEEKYVPVDFSKYKEVYVFCDSDPIGLYLNQKKIHYHALEDGLNYLKPYTPVPAKADNRGGFAMKKFFSMNLNLIFIRDGYSKYCIDMEVNDLSVIDDTFKKYKEVPRAELSKALDKEAKEIMMRVFVKDFDNLKKQLSNVNSGKKNIIILTEPLTTDLKQREKLFRDLVNEYSKEGCVFLKPHPRDELDYPTVFSDCMQFDRTVPMEILNFFEDISFDKVVAIYTQLDAIRFAKEKVFLGHDFMDKYEDPEIHRKNRKVNV